MIPLATPQAAPQGDQPPASEQAAALGILGTLHQLSLEAFVCQDRQELIFRLLNRTIMLLRYDRAALLAWQGKGVRLLGVSGQSGINPQSEVGERWRRLAAGLDHLREPTVLGPGAWPAGQAQPWQDLAQANGGTQVLWLPLVVRQRLVAVLWLERWQARPWEAQEVKLATSLLVAYGAAWEKFLPRLAWPELKARLLSGRRLTWVLLALCLLCLVWRMPLRVVAPCELIPKDPLVVAAPLNGVISEVLVQPGQEVKEQDILFVYDKRTAAEELKVARQQVQILKSGLNRSRVMAFMDPKARAEVGLLELRLEQEETKLKLAEYNVSRLEVRAETKGTVVMDDPYRWHGRPVVVGENVMLLVDPQKSKVRVWLPESDNLEMDRTQPVKVLLNAMPESSQAARLTFVGQSVQDSSEGLPSVLAEAEWESPPAGTRIGMKGLAVLYGPRVSAAYWLVRKPLASLRRFLGL